MRIDQRELDEIKKAEKACDEMRKQQETGDPLLNKVKYHKLVDDSNRWQKNGHDRIYFNLKGYDESFRGCRNFKFYYDNDTKKLYMDEGKGIQSPEFKKASDSIFFEFETDIVYSN